MSGEGRKGLFYALLIPDVSIDFPEYRDPGILKGRYVKTGLSHECQETDCLE